MHKLQDGPLSSQRNFPEFSTHLQEQQRQTVLLLVIASERHLLDYANNANIHRFGPTTGVQLT